MFCPFVNQVILTITIRLSSRLYLFDKKKHAHVCISVQCRNLQSKTIPPKFEIHMQAIGGSRRGVPPAHAPPPQQDPFLLFSHTFSPKSIRVRGWHPPNGPVPPPTGNPGSATAGRPRSEDTYN